MRDIFMYAIFSSLHHSWFLIVTIL
jgi:hypothetical protein